MKIIKKLTVIFIFFSLFTVTNCSGVDDCEKCLSAQKAYFSALKDKQCNGIATLKERAAVVEACNGATKADYIMSVCRDDNQDTPIYTCD